MEQIPSRLVELTGGGVSMEIIPSTNSILVNSLLSLPQYWKELIIICCNRCFGYLYSVMVLWNELYMGKLELTKELIQFVLFYIVLKTI